MKKSQPEVAKLSKGNPGASHFLMRVFVGNELTQEESDIVGKKLESCPSLRGVNLYVLISDICQGDLKKAVKLCRDCPDDVLEEACSKRDYSGNQLVAPYLETESVES